ncbi:maleylpyruvate isomerase family mycothiol-dependent enzyme [Actinophytocola sp. NPDC049390]|uniref:maleylpyruvate isomerase family mycothiol-dependent enzyme n=1 Tax=Actinophytocola sp. NPDC049390 TaxID=3363894 RepID=UPI0037B97DF4
MDREQAWQAIEQERRRLADLLADLADDEWDTPSLSAGWRVRDVAAHVALAPQPPGPWEMVAWAVRARGSFHRLNHDISVAHAESRTGAELVAELRAHAASRRLPALTGYRNILFDTLVHVQDVAIPLHRVLPMPVAAARAGATRVWTMGWPFWARRRLAGFRLVATDTLWAVGDGEQVVCGPIEALLLLLTGRPVALDRLTGAGVDALTERVAGRSRA